MLRPRILTQFYCRWVFTQERHADSIVNLVGKGGELSAGDAEQSNAASGRDESDPPILCSTPINLVQEGQ